MVKVEEQLTLDVGRALEAPELASFKLSGRIASATRELYADDAVQVIVMDADGEVAVSAFGVIRGVAFKKHTPKDGRPWVERVHTIKLD